ncbi:Cytoplasmic tRNA 2-thiolation protein 2 [Smittium culicis]|uniref:Cytoplasmic tRNA 2-thiolation protein 2 n=1 Tax=Smittium culicis TaxID=133412 RepID=A0A1R1YHE0_9FUNG|nr:Cytoplasmic tRNA 2-thiolation protein 2 [Smittium culicis]
MSQTDKIKNLCIKCKEEKSTILIRQAKFCTNCFNINYINKFKSNLSKSGSPAVDIRADVMVAVSGGANSMSLLSLISDFQLPKASLHQKYNSLSIGHIDESTLFPLSPESSIIEEIKNFPFKLETRKLEDVFNPELYQNFYKTHEKDGNDLVFSNNLIQNMKSPSKLLLSLFDNITSPSTKEYMLTQIKNFLILDMAKKLGCHVAAVGDTSTLIAHRSILNIVEGRGYSLPFDIGAESAQDPLVWILRPLRTSTKKEVAFYNHDKGLKSFWVPSFSTMASTSNNSTISLGHLTETFLVGLDAEYPATISTVASTVSKIKINDETSSDSPPCILCFSKISKHAAGYKLGVSVGYEKESTLNLPSSSDTSNLIHVQNHLCYSCIINVDNITPGTTLPGFLSIPSSQ